MIISHPLSRDLFQFIIARVKQLCMKDSFLSSRKQLLFFQRVKLLDRAVMIALILVLYSCEYLFELISITLKKELFMLKIIKKFNV